MFDFITQNAINHFEWRVIGNNNKNQLNENPLLMNVRYQK